nr:AraC family transcriptional regulator [Pseudenhygromyxa sp. WMMC2535]
MIESADPGPRTRALLQSVGIDPSALDPEQHISEDAYCTLLEALAALSEETKAPLDFHVRMGAAMRCEQLGALGLAWKSAPRIGDSFDRLLRYSRLVNRLATFGLRERGDRLLLTSQRAGGRLGALLSKEATLMTISTIIKESAGEDVAPLEVHYRHAKLASAPALAASFGCPVRFEQDTDALVFARELRARPNRLGDEGIHRFFGQHLDRALGAEAIELPLDERVRAEVRERLSEGVPRVSEIAGRLGMSGRTLQRRLRERELSYQSLADEARRQLAERLLHQTDYSLAEVAFLTGFSEQSAFTRAFKRWSGQTPRSFRLRP